MAKDEKLNWVDLNVDALSQGEQAAYQVYKNLQRQAAEQRTAFEKLMNENAHDNGLPAGKKLVFGYRFGKLSAAIVDAEETKARPAQAKMSLSDFLAGQASQGRRT